MPCPWTRSYKEQAGQPDNALNSHGRAAREKRCPIFYRGDSQMAASAAAAKAFDGAVLGDGRQRRRENRGKERGGRKGRANSGNPIASSPREGSEGGCKHDGRTDDFVGKCISQLEAAAVSRARTNGSLSVSVVVAIRGGDRRTDRPRSLFRRFRCR